MTSQHRPRLFLLDDSRTVLAALRRDLGQAGFDVSTAVDPSEISPDDLSEVKAIVVDVQMEQVFGDDVVSFMRQAWNLTAPIILYSSLPQAELDRRAQAAGASGALCKTAGSAALIALLKQTLGDT